MTTAPAAARSDAAPAATPPRPAPTRLLSLDAFRGATIAAMILVNDPGDGGHVYWPLQHARWNGWTPTDLIFPFFVFMMGMSLTFSTRLHGREAYFLEGEHAIVVKEQPVHERQLSHNREEAVTRDKSSSC